MTTSRLKKQSVICLMGPTASGKTALAVELAKALQGEVVSVDSALIYKDMNVGTAKPSEAEKQGVAHHLIDILTPDKSYSVADFVQDVSICIDDIIKRDKVPILAGGTMMYFNALQQGISHIPPANKIIRDEISQQIANKGVPALHDELSKVDVITAARIHPNDHQRVTRALEVYRSSGKPISYWHSQKQAPLAYDYHNFALMTENRALLHQRIEQRFKQMLEYGLVDEVTQLMESYSLHADLPSMRCVGYRQVLGLLNGEYDYESMVSKGIAATRQLAKRQITWIRAWQELEMLNISDNNSLQTVLRKVGVTP